MTLFRDERRRGSVDLSVIKPVAGPVSLMAFATSSSATKFPFRNDDANLWVPDVVSVTTDIDVRALEALGK